MTKTLIEGYRVDWDGQAHPPIYQEEDEPSSKKHSGVRAIIVLTLIIICWVTSFLPGGQVIALPIGLALVIYLLVWTIHYQSERSKNRENRPYCCKCGKYNGKRYHDVICEICHTKV
jgi:hypothetical protein